MLGGLKCKMRRKIVDFNWRLLLYLSLTTVKEFTANRCPNSSCRAQLMTPDKRIVCRGVMVPATIRHKIIGKPSSAVVLETDDGMSQGCWLGQRILRCTQNDKQRDLVCKGKGRSDLLKYLMVGVGGCLGSILRFWLGSYIGNKMGTRFPYGTFVINITGSFLIGLVFALLTVKTEWSPNWRYLIPIGFIGGYTTFSSFEFETLRTIQDGQIGLGLLYVAASVVVGFVAVWGGMIAGRAMVG